MKRNVLITGKHAPLVLHHVLKKRALETKVSSHGFVTEQILNSKNKVIGYEFVVCKEKVVYQRRKLITGRIESQPVLESSTERRVTIASIPPHSLFGRNQKLQIEPSFETYCHYAALQTHNASDEILYINAVMELHLNSSAFCELFRECIKAKTHLFLAALHTDITGHAFTKELQKREDITVWHLDGFKSIEKQIYETIYFVELDEKQRKFQE